MSSKKLVCFLVISFVCGLIVSGVAHASIVGIKGIVTDAEGTPLVGVKVTARDFGSIPITSVTGPDGAYTIPYISFANVVIKVGDEIAVVATDPEGNVVEKTHTVTAADITAGQATFNITFVSTTVTVSVAPTVFSADAASTATVTVTVAGDEPVTDETVTLRISPQVGSVDATATNNGDGTYSAVYTSGGAAGRVTITATATDAKASGSATVTINAGAPTAISLKAMPETVSSLASSIITATVSDSKGNGVGGVSLTGATSGDGSITNFVEDSRIFGAYTATYTAPMVDAEGTEMITVTAADISAELTLNLTPVPPREVTILTVEGTVFKEDGEIPADNVKVTVTVGANPPQMGTTDEDGNYSVTLFNPLGIARTGDPVSIVVTDDTDTKRGETSLILNNDQLGEIGTGTVDDGNVTTDIVIPPRSVGVLVVEGVIYSDDRVSPLEDVDVTVTVTVGSNPPLTAAVDEDGNYSATAIDLLGTVASTGDMVSTVVVTDADGAERGRNSLNLSNKQLGETGSATVTLDVMTDITLPPKSVNILIVEGVVSRDDGTTPVGPGVDVAVTVGSNPVQTTQTESDGSFSTTTLDLLAPVASTGDRVSIVVSDGSGERGRASVIFRNVHLDNDDSATVTQNVTTNIGATSGVLTVTGIVYLKNGQTLVPAASHLREGDLTVVVTNTTRNLTASGTVDDDGGYDVTFLNLLGIVAETGDSLTLEVEVLNEAGDAVGRASHTLTTAEVAASKAEVDIRTTVPAEVRVLDIIGSVVELDGTAAGAGLEVSIAIETNGQTMRSVKALTDATGGYEHTFVDLINPVAATGDILVVDVLREVDQYRGHRRKTLHSYELVESQLTVKPIELFPPRLELGGLSINTHYTGIQDPVIQQLLGMDLAGLAAAAGASIGGPEGDPLVMLPPSLPLLISPILAAIGAFQLELPPGFEPTDENIAQENFGNAITTRPTAWATLSADARDPGRWVNGDQLNLYISGASTIESVTFSLNGSPMSATPVPAGGSFMYNFQLEEELIALFEGNMPAFGAVQLMIDGQMPRGMTRNDMGVWSVEAPLTPGSTVAYYYMITLARPYHDPMAGLTVTSFPLIDPRNRQLKTSGLSQAIEGLLTSELGALDPGLRSVFSVPVVDIQQSLWVGKFNLDADGMYQLDVNVSYRGGYQDPSIAGKMFTVDRTAPTADVALSLDAPGMNASMYSPADGYYIATGPMPGEASLTVSAIPGATSEAAGYMYQLARLDVAGNPGTWNPVITADLLPLNLEKLLSDPASVLPLTSGGPIDMLIRNAEGGALLGTYGLRAVGIDSLLNMDSSRSRSVIVELVPPDPDIAVVSSVQADFNGNGAIEGLEMQSTAGDVVIFSDSMVTLTVDMIERTRHPLTSIALEFQIPGGNWQPIGMFTGDQLATTMMGDQLSVPLPVPDIPVLPDRGGHVMVRTVTTNALNIVNEQVFSAAYQRRLAPEVSGIYTTVTERHPDSGAPQGMVTVSAFTAAMTAPDTAAVQLEIRRSADADWMPLGVVQIADTTVTSHVEIAIIEDLVNSILSGSPTAPISPLYRKWSLAVDSATLEDTILDDTPAASDASLDDNPYVVRAIAVDTAGTGYPSADGVEDSFSLDNYSPTAITTVTNEVEMVGPREDGSYYVSGLLHESVPDPMLTLTSRTGAHPSAFTGGIALAVNDASGTAMEIPATGFSDSGNYTFTGVFNLSSIPNGTYTFMAAAHAADGSPEARIVAMAITVEVGNFTPPENFADPSVDILSVTNTRGEANSPADTDAMYPIGFPAIDDKVTATLVVPNVAGGDIDVLIGPDGMSAAMMGALMVMEPDANNNIVIMIDTSGLDEGMYGLVGTVTKPNGSVPFGLPSIRVDRTGPVVEIVSPVSRHQVTTLPTIHVTFTDITGFDVTEDPMSVVISLTRLADDVAIAINTSLIRITAAAEGEILTQSGDIAYTHDDPVVGGAYRIGVTVMDVFGNESTAEPVEFTVEGVQPTVSIVSPLAGRIIDPRQPLIVSVALTGNGDITVSEFQINGNDMEGTLEDNWLTYTMQPPLVGGENSVLQRGSENTISVKIVDTEGRTAEGSTTFVVSLDDTAPVISGPAPRGEVTRKIGRVTARVTDNESNLTRIQYAIDDEPLRDISFSPGRVVEVGGGKEVKGQTSFNFFDAPLGTHSVTIVAESTGGSTTLTWEFTIIAPDTTPPQIVTYSPLGIIRTDRPVLAATVSDESGFKRDGITLILAGVPGNQGSGRRSSPTSTTVTFTPSISVTPGPYTARITVIDRYNNRTEAEWQFTVELDETPPSITTSSPHGIIRSDKPIVSVSASDDRSGVDSIEIVVKDDGNNLPVNGTTSVRSDKTAATFTPTQPLNEGTYTVDVKVMDVAGNQAASKWQFTVELDTIPPTILITRPSQEHTENRRPIISATYTDNLSGIDVDSVKLSLDGTTIEPDEVSETQVIFTPKFDLTFDMHTVTLEVSDTAPTPNTATQEWSFYVERIGIADARNYPNPFEDDTTIAFRLSRQAKVTIRIYDFTGRIVAQPITNSIREAGLVEVAWNGSTSANEHLARGVYFCHILMESELEPQSTILKLAIVSK